MPHVAKMIDELKKELPGIKVLWAEEGQYQVGSREGLYIEFKGGSDEFHTKSGRRKRKTIQNDVAGSQPKDD